MGDTTVISETRFARGYSSFWRSAAPTMELYVKRCNLDGYERNFERLHSIVDPDRRAITNQIAFELFCSIIANGGFSVNINYEVHSFINFDKSIDSLNISRSDLSTAEITEASALAKRMWSHFARRNIPNIIFKPRFKGCGIILSCVGDVLVDDNIIIEFKDGDRPFRSYEFRQLSVYSALYYRDRKRLPKAIGVLNSRRGTYIEIGFQDFVQEISGRSGLDYIHEITGMISEITITQ